MILIPGDTILPPIFLCVAFCGQRETVLIRYLRDNISHIEYCYAKSYEDYVDELEWYTAVNQKELICTTF